MGLESALPAVAIAQAGMGIIQSGIGIFQQAASNRRLKRLLQQRELYTTPQEFFDMNNMALNSAQTGYDADTMAYLTGQTDRALTSSFGAITRLGGDQNDISSIFDRSIQSIIKNAADSEMIKLKKFDTLMQTVGQLGQEKKAEFADRELLLKDKMAAEGMKAQAGAQNLQSGLNTVGSAIANAFSLYGGDKPDNSGSTPLGSRYNNAGTVAPASASTNNLTIRPRQ